MKTPSTDIVRDMLDRLRTAFEAGQPLQGEFWESFETDIRAEWGGDRHYVHAAGSRKIAVLEERNRSISTDYYVHKISLPALREKWGLSRPVIYKIIKNTPLAS